METIKFIDKIDLLKVEQRFKNSENYFFDGTKLSFSVDNCCFVISSESISCQFPPEKYYVVANTLLNIIDTPNASVIQRLLSLIGDSEFVKTGELNILLEKYKKENETILYENTKLINSIKQLEVALLTQEAQLADLRKRIMQYETLPDNLVSELIVMSIKESQTFSVGLFAKKHNLTPNQVSKCLSSLISRGIVSSIGKDEYYSKEFDTNKYKLMSSVERLLFVIKNIFVRKQSPNKTNAD